MEKKIHKDFQKYRLELFRQVLQFPVVTPEISADAPVFMFRVFTKKKPQIYQFCTFIRLSTCLSVSDFNGLFTIFETPTR